MAESKQDTINNGTMSYANSLMNETLVILGMLQMFLAAAIPALKRFQAPLELFLLMILIYGCITRVKYDKWQILLLLIFPFVTVISFFMTDRLTFAVNAKQNGLAVLSLLYFSRVRFRSKWILPVFILTLSSMILNRIAPVLTSPIISLTFNDEFNATRFGGIFLNAHFNAYFIAVPLIFYGYEKRLHGLGAVTIFMTGSKFVFVSYITNHFSRLTLSKFLMRYQWVLITIVIVGIYVITQFSEYLIGLFDTRYTGSASVILMQLFDPAYYALLLHPFPSAMVDVSDQAMALYKRHDGLNEIGYFALATQSGFILSTIYLSMLLKYTRHYRIFILVSLLHYGYVLSPVIIYMLVHYSREIEALKVPSSGKRRSWFFVFFERVHNGKVALDPVAGAINRV